MSSYIISDSSGKPYFCLAVDQLPDRNFVSPGSGGTQTIPRHQLSKGLRYDNVTDWALAEFVAHYGSKHSITKDDVFHHVYVVLHDPAYREAYALNLRREFLRIPFYAGFPRWATWGKALMNIHIGCEAVEPWLLIRTGTHITRDLRSQEGEKAGPLCRDCYPLGGARSGHARSTTPTRPDAGIIEVDTDTQLAGVPPQAWAYRLGTRSAVEWVLDQHKEKKPSDPMIREHIDTYRLADHKEQVIDLLGRVCRVSVETVAIIEAMRNAPR